MGLKIELPEVARGREGSLGLYTRERPEKEAENGNIRIEVV